MRNLLFTLLILGKISFVSAQSRNDAENFVLNKLLMYATPLPGITEAQKRAGSIVNEHYDISIINDELTIIEINRAGDYKSELRQIVKLRFFQKLLIGNKNGNLYLSIFTNGNNCINRVNFPGKGEKEERSEYIIIPLYSGTVLESNLEARLNRALTDLKKFSGGEDKY